MFSSDGLNQASPCVCGGTLDQQTSNTADYTAYLLEDVVKESIVRVVIHGWNMTD